MGESWLQKIRQGFSRTFWVANIIELFERLAYYGSKAVLAVYVAEQVGLGPEKAGWLVGSLFNTLLYFLPILAGTVVDRYGFKKSLTVCFTIFTLGYFLIGLAGFWTLLAGVAGTGAAVVAGLMAENVVIEIIRAAYAPLLRQAEERRKVGKTGPILGGAPLILPSWRDYSIGFSPGR